MRELDREDIEALAVGASILGTGGGGSPYHALLNLRRLYDDGVRIRLLSPSDLNDDDDVAVVSFQGAPLVLQERLTDSRQSARAVEVMQDYIGRKFRGVMSIEVGGGNGLQALMAAAHLDIPVIDCDAMGRAFPEAQMTTFAVGDLAPGPLTSVDPRGNEVIVTRVASWKWMERTSRKICTEFGSIASTCKAPRKGAEVKRWGVHGTTTKAINLGRAIQKARKTRQNPVAAILESESGQQIFVGKVTGIERRTTEGFLRGRAEIEGFDSCGGRSIALDFQNEWIIAWEDDKPLVMSPDLICVLDSDTGDAIGTELMRYGQRITVVALPAHDIFLTPRGLQHVGPSAFGYHVPFKSVFLK